MINMRYFSCFVKPIVKFLPVEVTFVPGNLFTKKDTKKIYSHCFGESW